MILWRKREPSTTIHYRRIVLTGAASGIGRALLAHLAALPAQIVVIDKDAKRLAEAIQPQGSPQAKILPLALDVSRPESIDILFDYAVVAMEGIDLFIANAGVAVYGPLHHTTSSQLERLLRTNVLAPIYAVAKMVQLNGHRPYKVVMIASAMAHTALPGYAAYAGTKAALHRFAEAYRFELPDPRHLMLVYPIATRTNFFSVAADWPAPVPWPSQSPEKVAQAVLKGLSQDWTVVFPSSTFRVYTLAERLLPWLRRAPQQLAQWQFQRWSKNRHKM